MTVRAERHHVLGEEQVQRPSNKRYYVNSIPKPKTTMCTQVQQDHANGHQASSRVD